MIHHIPRELTAEHVSIANGKSITGGATFVGSIRAVSIPLLLTAFYYYSFHALSITGADLISAGYKILVSAMVLTTVLATEWRMSRILALTGLTIGYAVNAIHFYRYGGPLSPGGLSSSLESNSREVVEFLSLIPARSIVQTIVFIVVGVFSIRRFTALQTRDKKRLIRARFAWTVLIPLLLVPFIRRSASTKFWREISRNPVAVTANLYTHVPVIGEALLTLGYYEQRAGLTRLEETTQPTNIVGFSDIGTPEIVVLVIGETTPKNHLSAYGYGIDTSPFLSDLRSDPGAIFMENAVAPASITRESLIRVLSFATTYERKPYLNNWNVIDVARNAGYSTDWLSNQWPYGSDESAVGAVAHLADRTEYIQFDAEGPTFDTDLADRFGEVLNAPERALSSKNSPDENKRFFVLHLAGSHYRYDARSTSEDKAYIQATRSEEPEFDASVYETDRTLQRVIETLRIREESSVVLFASDHGEEVGLKSHGFPELSRVQVEVPCVIWANHPPSAGSILAGIASNRIKPFSTENVPFILSKLFGWTLRPDPRRDPSLMAYFPGTLQVLNVDGRIIPVDDSLPYSLGNRAGSWLFGY